MWLSDSTVWHRLALGRHLIEACGSRPGAPRGQSAGVRAPSGGCAVWKEARGRAPVPTKCCLRASGRGAGGADSKVHVNSNEEDDKTPETLRKHTANGTARRPTRAPQQPGRFWFLVPGTTQPRGERGLWRKTLLPSPRRTRGKETGHLEDEPLLGEGASETSVETAEQVCPEEEGSPGRAGMVASVGVSSFRRAWQAFQCFPRSPCTRAGH